MKQDKRASLIKTDSALQLFEPRAHPGYPSSRPVRASYYTEDTEAFTVPKPWPKTVELGANCRAMVLNRKLRSRVTLESITLEALSQESVIGLMGVSIMNPHP